MRILKLCLICLCLSSCSGGILGQTFDCTDLKRLDNCIIFGVNDNKREYKKVSNYSKSANTKYYKTYTPRKITKPAKTWGK